MAPAGRWALAAVALAAVVAAVVVSRHASAPAVGAAAGAPPATIVSAADLPVLDAGPAPSVAAAAGWLNSTPLDAAALAGKVVLYEFWTFECINCQHVQPHVIAWQQRYAKDGLVIVAIHTPEFDIEADPHNVAEYVTTHGITYPVALDPEHTVWNTWHNRYWPNFFLYDGAGQLRLRHVGEGGYDTTEDALRVLLGVDPNSPRAVLASTP